MPFTSPGDRVVVAATPTFMAKNNKYNSDNSNGAEPTPSPVQGTPAPPSTATVETNVRSQQAGKGRE